MKRSGKQTAEYLIRNKKYAGLKVTEKQKEEIQKVIDFIGSDDNKNNILKRQWCYKTFPKMVESGVDNLYLKRLLWKRKFTKQGPSLAGMLILYGKKGVDYWNEFKRNNAYSNTFEYKKEKFGWTKKQFDEYNKNRAVTLHNCIKKHGKEKGEKIYNDYVEKQRYSNTLEYFIEKFDGDAEKGISEYKKYNKSKRVTYENLMKKYGNEEKVLDVLLNKKISKTSYSKISQELFESIYLKLPQILKEKTYFAILNKEFGKMCKENKKYFFYDFVISNIKFCIEFHGDQWHGNPTMFTPNETPPIYKSIGMEHIKSKDLWEKDKLKKELLTSNGFCYISIWESDYKNNKDKIVNKCLELINEKYKNYK